MSRTPLELKLYPLCLIQLGNGECLIMAMHKKGTGHYQFSRKNTDETFTDMETALLR